MSYWLYVCGSFADLRDADAVAPGTPSTAWPGKDLEAFSRKIQSLESPFLLRYCLSYLFFVVVDKIIVVFVVSHGDS